MNSSALCGERSFHQRFGQRRVRVKRQGDLLEGDSVLDPQRRSGEELGGSRACDVVTEHPPGGDGLSGPDAAVTTAAGPRAWR